MTHTFDFNTIALLVPKGVGVPLPAAMSGTSPIIDE